MKLLHEKSECCGAKIIRFGGKRRQCVACKKTWRVHPAKRGRKKSRKQMGYLNNVFRHGSSVKLLASHSTLSVDAIYKRFTKNLHQFNSRKRAVRVRGKKLILVIDAQWQYFNGDLWTLYFVAVKSNISETVTIFDPVLKQGKENAVTWNELFDALPLTLKNRVVAVVSDGIKGIETVTANHGWIIQRCHFHLLKTLQKMRGKRLSTSGRLIREEIYCTAKRILSERSKRKLKFLCNRLAELAKDDRCPRKMRMTARDFLRRLSGFRSYREFPDFNLPVTVNVMESINSFIRRKSRTVNSPTTWLKWAIACIRLKSKFTCK